jgi:uncharacterized RDD family membrane protein YckC
LESEVERATDAVLAGPLPEAVARSLVEQRVVERIVSQLVDSGELDRMVSSAVADARMERLVREVAASPAVQQMLVDAVESPMAADLTERLVRRPEIQGAIEDAVGAALARRAATMVDRVVGGARRMDARLESAPRRWARRPPRSASQLSAQAGVPYAGLGSRIPGFLVDVVAVHIVYLVGVAMVGLALTLANWTPSHGVADALAAAGWAAFVTVYFTGFWATAGQTPGMALLRMRLVGIDAEPPGWGRSFVRLVGALVAVAFPFIGFLPVLVDDRRRALQDFLARTVVIYEPAPRAIEGTPELSSPMLPV